MGREQGGIGGTPVKFGDPIALGATSISDINIREAHPIRIGGRTPGTGNGTARPGRPRIRRNLTLTLSFVPRGRCTGTTYGGHPGYSRACERAKTVLCH